MKKLLLISLSAVLVALSACSDDEPPSPETLVAGFTSTSIGLSLDDTKAEVHIEFSRPVEIPGEVILTIEEEVNATYGIDYITSPEAVNKQLLININEGDERITFEVNKLKNPAFGVIKSFRIQLVSIPENGILGTNSSTVIIFAENPVSSGATLDLEVGGDLQPNQVFVDLSKQTGTIVLKDSWDLGFYTGDDHRVVINSAVGMLVKSINKTDLSTVNASDTIGLSHQLDLDAIFASLFGPPPSWLSQASSWVDDPTGNLHNTAIKEISPDDADNPVYIVNRGKSVDGSQRGWMKIRILQQGEGYKLQYGPIDQEAFTEITIDKNPDFNFTYVSLDGQSVSVEPPKDSWDIAFTTYTNLIPIDATNSIPYMYKDYVIQNRNLNGVAQVLLSEGFDYETFTVSQIQDLEFSSNINSIGSSWRTVSTPGSGTETDVNKDRFYVLEDPDGNFYKLKFTAMLHSQTGERGFPQIQYELL